MKKTRDPNASRAHSLGANRIKRAVDRPDDEAQIASDVPESLQGLST